MEQDRGYQPIINKLYAIYEEKGFLREEEALELMAADNVSLVGINRITDKLVGMGVIFAENQTTIQEESDDDYSRTDYDSVFVEVLYISPGQVMLIDYIRETRPPQRREWINLMPQAKSGNQYAFKRLFDMYLRVVVKLALDMYKTNGYELDDLFQEGAMGLMRSIYKYNAKIHGSFVSYFPWWVRQYMTRAIADYARTIRIPVHLVETINKMVRVSRQINQRLSREATNEEIAVEMEIEPCRVEEIRRIAQLPVSLETPIGDEEGSQLGDLLEDKNFPSLEETAMEHILHEQIEYMLKNLSTRERDVLSLRFGLDDGHSYTLEEVGRKFGVTRERIRQIEVKALRKLRHPSKIRNLKSFLA